MSLLARFEAALLRRHARACPWPTGAGAVTTHRAKGATMARDEHAGVASGTEGESGPILSWCLREADGRAEDLEAALTIARATIKELEARELAPSDFTKPGTPDWNELVAENDILRATNDSLEATIARMRTGRP